MPQTKEELLSSGLQHRRIYDEAGLWFRNRGSKELVDFKLRDECIYAECDKLPCNCSECCNPELNDYPVEVPE